MTKDRASDTAERFQFIAGTPIPGDDVWVHTACDMCFGSCGVIAHRVNGVIVKIEGDPDAPHSRGRICPKGNAALMGVYDPSRVTRPLKRTNAAKGVGADPGWVEISWDEALDTITERLRRIREDDPRKLLLACREQAATRHVIPAWSTAFGTPNVDWLGYFCGNYLHSTMYLTNGTFHSDFDLEYCNYAILLGNQHGFLGGVNPNIDSQRMAEARMRGMKVVVVDPIGTNAASKADEWVSIRPGTDAAFVLALINLLVNELNIYDADFLTRHANGAYLTGPDELYVRDPATHKPLVWDETSARAVPFDTQGTTPALEGNYDVGGLSAVPAFQRLREHVRKYTPEQASEVTTIPAATIRRIAREFGEAANVGSTITVEGKVLPYRPAAINIYRGAGAHKHGGLTGLAVQTLNMVVGAYYVPGSHRGPNLVGPSGYSWSWKPRMADDGLVVPADAFGESGNYYHLDVRPPQTLGLREIFPICTNRSPNVQLSIMHPERFKVPYKVEAMVQVRANVMMRNANVKAGEEALKNIPFIASFCTQLDETSEFADIVLPDCHSLERLAFHPNFIGHTISPASGYYYWGIRQPVVCPPPEVRDWRAVMLEIADRLGILGDVYTVMNHYLGVKGSYALDPAHKYSWEDIYDRQAKSMFGPDMGLDWFRQHGYHKVRRSVEERYPRQFLPHRFPIYFENVKRAGQKVKAVVDELDIPIDPCDYQVLPDWKPCPAYETPSPDFDLFATNYKVPMHYQTFTTQNPWLNELAERHPYAYKVMMNAATAQRKGIKDGDLVWVESEVGKVKGVARLSECVHPEVLGMAGNFGSWAKGKPIAMGKGLHWNALLPLDTTTVDSLSTSLDSCVRVKVYRAT